MSEGSLEVKLPTIWTDGKAAVGVRGKKIREEKRVRGKKMQVREKVVGKSRFTVFLQWFVAPEGWKVGSLKRLQSHLARWEIKTSTPLWCEAHVEVKMYKTLQNKPFSEHFWKLRCSKSVHRCGLKHISKSKWTKHQVRSTFGSWDVEKLHAIVARSTFPSQHVENTWKHHMLGALLKVQMWFCVAGPRDSAPGQKWAKRKGFLACPQTMAGVGHVKRICKDAFSVAGAVQETVHRRALISWEGLHFGASDLQVC